MARKSIHIDVVSVSLDIRCEDDLKDEDLPLRFVTIKYFNNWWTRTIHGIKVERSVDFYGDDGQPVIFGTLFKQTFIEDKLTNAEFNAKKQTCFKPYTLTSKRNRLVNM